MDDIEIVDAFSDGVIEVGEIVISYKNQEVRLYTEEFGNSTQHSFHVYFNNKSDNELFNFEISEDLEIKDKLFVNRMFQEYQKITTDKR